MIEVEKLNLEFERNKAKILKLVRELVKLEDWNNEELQVKIRKLELESKAILFAIAKEQDSRKDLK